MKVVIGPLNIASQPYFLARGLRKFGVDATCLTYTTNKFGYASDWPVDLPKSPVDRVATYHEVLSESLKKDYDIYHFFQRPFYLPYPAKAHNQFLGFEIPLLKARGKLLAYRFTGWELIDKEIELQNNPYSAFRHGWDGAFDEKCKKEYLDFLKCYCDAFMVVDPMMREHLPEAHIVPRILPVDDFQEVGIEKRSVPVIVHAPSNKTYKGSNFILKALQELKEEGVAFKLELLEGVPYKEAIECYKRADIIIDQILIGWYGVLATECMAMGKPVAVYMRDDLVKTPDDVPIWNMNLDNVKNRLKELITNFDLREELARRGRQYVESVHAEDVVIPKLIKVYEHMAEHGNRHPMTDSDLKYLFLQRSEIEKLFLENMKLKRALQTKQEKLSSLMRKAGNIQKRIPVVRKVKNKVKQLFQG